ncbi:MAG: hypothetical protein KDA89_10195 [Planctomycetaceae bacterium]|nr:hypothetical protein [Planctomycetaceae bacterium]
MSNPPDRTNAFAGETYTPAVRRAFPQEKSGAENGSGGAEHWERSAAGAVGVGADGEFSPASGVSASAVSTHVLPTGFSHLSLVFRQSPSRIRLIRTTSAEELARAKQEARAAQARAAAKAEEQKRRQQEQAEDQQQAARITEQLNYLQELLNNIGVAVEELQQQHRDSLTELQQAAVELAVVAASWIVGAAIDADIFAVDDLVAQMVAQLHREQPIRIFLNPDDAILLEHLRGSSDVPQFAAAEIEFVPEPELSRGICRAESSRTTLVTDMDDRLAEIRRIWMENLNETQTERRTDDPTGRRFRRFPDRRHTA